MFQISRAALLLILIGALAVRVHRLGAQSLWYDEAVTAHVVGQGIAELTRWTADDIQPPLYYYVVAGWTAVAGRSEWALRFPSAFFGALTVALMWAAARRLFASRAAALLAALLAAFSPLYVYYAQEARMYTQLTFLGLLAGYALWRAMEARDRAWAHSRAWARSRAPLRWWFVFVAAATAALYTHYFAAFLLLAYALCVLAALIWPTMARVAQTRRASLSSPYICRALCVLAALICRVIAHAAQSKASLSSPYIRRAVAAAAAGAAIVLLYAPWLPAMLTRYRVDRSYWQGALKLGEALRHVTISFTVAAPEMMLETDAVRLLPWFGAIFVVAVAGLFLRAVTDVGRDAMTDEDLSPAPSPARRGTPHPPPLSYEERGGETSPSLQGKGAGGLGVTFEADGRPSLRSRWPLLVLLICLLAPTVGILALASRTPKFNARYLMMASPAYLLLLAGGLAAWVGDVRRPATADRRPPTGDRRPLTADRRALNVMALVVRRASVIAAVGFLLVVSFVSVRNWFTDRAFAKAQWRELAATVRAKMAADEAVVLVSGHAWPAWDYYAADIPAIRLP
ncbi:MAG: glycosyltransferase family 39 protein, partial [Anaerolineae bacterium]